MAHPFHPGQSVRCVRAPESGIPLTEGQLYVVRTAFVGGGRFTEDPIPGMESVPGVTVEGAPGYFTADRFEALRD